MTRDGNVVGSRASYDSINLSILFQDEDLVRLREILDPRPVYGGAYQGH